MFHTVPYIVYIYIYIYMYVYNIIILVYKCIIQFVCVFAYQVKAMLQNIAKYSIVANMLLECVLCGQKSHRTVVILLLFNVVSMCS